MKEVILTSQTFLKRDHLCNDVYRYFSKPFWLFLHRTQCEHSGKLGMRAVKGALSRGSAGYEVTEKFTHCCPSWSPWIAAILGHLTLKPTRMLSFLPGHHEDMFFLNLFLSFEKKNVLERCSSDQLCMSAVQRLRRAGGFLAVCGAPPQDGTEKAGWFSMWWGALVSVWFWLFRRKIRARRQLRGQRLLPDYGDDRPAIPCGEDLLASGEGNESDRGTIHVVFSMSTRPVNLLGLLNFLCACLVWDVSCRRSRATMGQSVAQPWTWPLSLSSSRTRKRERERERERELSSEKNGYLRNKKRFFLQAEPETAATSQHRRDLQTGRACMPRLKGALDPPAQHGPERSLAEVPVTVTVGTFCKTKIAIFVWAPGRGAKKKNGACLRISTWKFVWMAFFANKFFVSRSDFLEVNPVVRLVQSSSSVGTLRSNGFASIFFESRFGLWCCSRHTYFLSSLGYIFAHNFSSIEIFINSFHQSILR